VMVHRLNTGHVQVTALNFSNSPILDRVVSDHFSPGAAVIDMFSGRRIGIVDEMRSFPVGLNSHQGLALLIVAGTQADLVARTAVGEGSYSS
jgi:hypothetical protein